MSKEYSHIQREFGPVYNSQSQILILGSFPSAKSREANFFYGHPNNRFWPLLSRLTGTAFPADKEGKTILLLEKGIALWDSIDSCDIIGSSDSSIKNVVPVTIMEVLNCADIKQIYANGKTSASVYMKYLYHITGRNIITLPSTSPANAAWTMDRLAGEWVQILEHL